MKFKGLIAITVLCSFLTGCCSIVGQSVFPVTVNSNPAGANITITDEHGTVMFAGTTPTTMTLTAGESYMHAKAYTIKYSKPGYNDQVSIVRADIDGWFFGNILFGGIIGMLIIDPITGKMWKLPNQTFGNLSPIGAVPDVTAPASVPAAPATQGNGGSVSGNKTSMNKSSRVLQVASIDQVPQEDRKYLIALN